MLLTKKEKIKIAYILPSLDKGGAERFIVDLILSLNKEIFEPVLVLFKRGGEWEQELAAQNIPVVIFHKQEKVDLKNFWQLLSFLKKFQPRIVHTQLGGDIYGRLAAKILRTPVIITTEQNVNPDETWHYNLTKRITARWADKIVAISRAVKKDLLDRYQTPENKIIIIPNGVEIETFLPLAVNSETKNDSKEPRPFLIGTIGRLSPQKGHSVLIEALAKLKHQNFQCQIASDGELRNKLTEQIKTSGLENKVKLVGYVQAAAFLNSLDIFVLPSLWEGLGIVLLEAGLCGRPTIASAVDGITDIIDEKTGWLVEPGDATDLAEKIDWLLDNLGTPEVTSKVKNLRAKVIAEFDIKKITDDYQTLYQKLLNDKITKVETK